MKFISKPAPNYRGALSTQKIMMNLTIGLGLILVFALINAYTISINHFFHVLLVTIISVGTSILVEILYALFMKKKPYDFIKISFPWVTALILVLILPLNVSFYATIICTICAIVFGKLLFGGFGNNIFNPAAVGRAIFAVSFTGSVASDVVVGATPTTTMSNIGWIASKDTLTKLISDFGGLSNMAMGNYYGAIGETSAILILAVGIVLAIKKVIDIRISMTYILTIFIGALFIGLANGLDFVSLLMYGSFHVLTGGVMFGAIFMLTDPVTSPTTRSGKILFAMGAAFLTLIIRIGANLPEGVLYSIVLMNMFTPAIDKAFLGQQYRRITKNFIAIVTIFVVGIVIVFGLGTSLEKGTYTKPDKTRIVTAKDMGNAKTYSAKGFQGINKFAIEVVDGKIVNIEVLEFNDTVGIGDLATNDTYFEYLKTADFDGEVDVVANATLTSNSIIEACKQALGK